MQAIRNKLGFLRFAFASHDKAPATAMTPAVDVGKPIVALHPAVAHSTSQHTISAIPLVKPIILRGSLLN